MSKKETHSKPPQRSSTYSYASLLMGLILVAGCLEAQACQCMYDREENTYKKSQSVFIARISQTWLETDQKDSDEVIRAEYETVEILKSGGQPRLLQYDSWNCSLPLLVGHEYLIYAIPPYINGSILHITVCSLSREYNKERDARIIEKYRSKKVL